MGLRWDDLNARASGLGTHLLGRTERERLAAVAGDGDALLRALPAEVRPPPEERRDARAVDRAVGRLAGQRMAVLERWAGERRAALAAVLEEEDRRSLRNLLRGAASGIPPEIRLDGLVPTSGLPRRLQERAARAEGIGGVVDCLVEGDHPFAPALEEEMSSLRAGGGPAEGGETGEGTERTGARALFRLETTLARAFADRAVFGARKAGAAFRRYVAETVDVENVWTALAAGADAAEWEDLFLEGGDRLGEERFHAVLRVEGRQERRERLARALGDSPLAPALEDGGPEDRLERRILEARLREAVAEARRDPLGPGPFLAFVLRLRVESADLRRIAWGFALDAPPEAREPSPGRRR